MTDNYTLTREQNVFLAKKLWDENIYCGMRMEGRNISFPETQTILSGINVGRVKLDDVQAILNMRDAWRHLLDTLDEPLTLNYLCAINSFVSRNGATGAFCPAFSPKWAIRGCGGIVCGGLRTGNVGIAGVSYKPPIPIADEAQSELSALLEKDVANTERSLSLFAWGTRRQLFRDGNKRTSLLAANKLLVAGGNGLLTIRDAQMTEFTTLLSAYYESGDSGDLKQFLYKNAIHGITFQREEVKGKR